MENMKPKRVELEQGSEKWLSWRRCHITASNAAALLNMSPWDTPYSVYDQMINGAEKPMNEAMQRGKDFEPVARAQLEKLLKIELEPAVFESGEFPFMGASLDAVTKDLKKGYEIKITGKKQLDKALKGEVPEHYNFQCQTQMLVMGWQVMWLFFWMDEDNFAIVPVGRDPVIIDQIVEASEGFWNRHILKQIPPPMSFRDWTVNDNAFDNKLAIEWSDAKMAETEAVARRKELEKQLIERAEGKSVKFMNAGVKLQQINRLGTIDWDKVCVDWKIDKAELEKYRKEKSCYVKISSSLNSPV